MKKFGINGQIRKESFLFVIYCFSLVKAALNAARFSKLRNGVKKNLNFFFIQWPKAEQRP